MTGMRWPFGDEQAFWDWVMDLDAVLDEQDEDLLLHGTAGLGLLVAAADRADCPKQRYCCSILEDYAREIVHGPDPDAVPALQAAVERARHGTDPLTRRWAAYVDRLFSYRRPLGPVTRAKTELVAADLLSGPSEQQRMVQAGLSDALVVQVTASGKHWQCTMPSFHAGSFLYINRRTGAWKRSFQRPLSADDLAAL